MNILFKPTLASTPYALITDAFDAIEDGDTLLVAGPNTINPDPDPAEAPLALYDKHDVEITGAGNATISGEGGGNFLSMELCTGIRVEGITFSGDRTEEGGGSDMFAQVLLRGTSNSALSFLNCTFKGWGGHAISHLWGAKTSSDVLVQGCRFSDAGSYNVPGLFVDGSACSGIGSRWRLVNNTVTNCVRGFEVESGTAGLIDDVLISGNSFKDVTDCAAFVCVTTGISTDFRNIRILGNRINTCYHTDSRVKQTAIAVGGGYNIIVADNQISDCKYGTSISSIQGDLANVLVHGNFIQNCIYGLVVQTREGGTNVDSMVSNNIVKNCTLGIIAVNSILSDNITYDA